MKLKLILAIACLAAALLLAGCGTGKAGAFGDAEQFGPLLDEDPKELTDKQLVDVAKAHAAGAPLPVGSEVAVYEELTNRLSPETTPEEEESMREALREASDETIAEIAETATEPEEKDIEEAGVFVDVEPKTIVPYVAEECAVRLKKCIEYKGGTSEQPTGTPALTTTG